MPKEMMIEGLPRKRAARIGIGNTEGGRRSVVMIAVVFWLRIG